jgi:hypothetical protein
MLVYIAAGRSHGAAEVLPERKDDPRQEGQIPD